MTIDLGEAAIDDLGRACAAFVGRPTGGAPATWAADAIAGVGARMADATPAELLGVAFESLLSAGERRARGTHYTPAAIARA